MFKNLKIGHKMALGFGLIIALNVIFGVYNFTGLQTIERYTTDAQKLIFH